MPHVYIEDIGKHTGEEVTIKGWLHNRRSSGKIHFLTVRDGSGFIQAVMSKAAVGEDAFKTADHLSQESSVTITGTAREDKRAPSGYEIDVKSFEVVGPSHDYPITPKEHGVDYLLDRRHLWIRTERQQAILRIRHEIINAVRDFFNDRGFILADTPIFTPAACEGTTTLFPAQYFEEQTAYLTQSGQLYNEANAMALGRVYCFGPTFRAEKSKTRRHLTEFWMVEPEMAYADLNDVMNLAEDLVVSIVGRVLDKRRRELTVLERDLSKLESVQKPFPRISYDDAVTTLQSKGLPIEWGGDFGGPDETMLSEQYDRPLMVHRYPAAVKAFYMKPDPQRPELALGVDVLAPEGYGEIIGGGERLADLDLLLARIKEHDLPQEAFEWYLDLRRYGTVPHGGFGMGIERVVAWICKLEHVRETIPYPRMLYRLYP
ncbi:MAG TPA: asparagine--tRNA ligase [Vicinamibacterales bacterium]|nr:asparagine--tRNA ligase [Vicinamibacterales bacterium]